MEKRINILGVGIDRHNMAEALETVKEFLAGDRPRMVMTPNSEMIMAARDDEAFREVLNSGDLVVADGIGVVYAARILKDPLRERVAGFDLASAALEFLSETGGTAYFLGGRPGVAEKAKEKLLEKLPALQVVGTHDGYFDEEELKNIKDELREKKPDLLLVCLGMKKQEQWMVTHGLELPVKVMMGVGGSLDVFAGEVQRAPEFFIDHHIEWAYRLLKQPSRFVRMLALPKFGFTVIWEKTKEGFGWKRN